jgi:hypothetical protein
MLQQAPTDQIAVMEAWRLWAFKWRLQGRPGLRQNHPKPIRMQAAENAVVTPTADKSASGRVPRERRIHQNRPAHERVMIPAPFPGKSATSVRSA